MGRGGRQAGDIQQRAAADRDQVRVPVQVKTLHVRLDFGDVEVGVFHPFATLQDYRRADQLQALPEGAEISLDAVRQVRLGAVQRFIEHDQGLGGLPAPAVEQQVSEQAVRHAERMARKINAVLETELNGPFDQGHRRSLQCWTRRFHRKFK